MPGVFAGGCRSPRRPGGAWNFVSSSRPWPSGVSIIATSARTPSSPGHSVHRTALDRPLALQLESELDEERRRGRKVVDHDAHVLQASDRHTLDSSDTDQLPRLSVADRLLMWLGGPRAGGAADQVVALGDVRGPAGGIGIGPGSGREVAAELVQMAADGVPAVSLAEHFAQPVGLT
jgi:hypothetical protein